MCVGEIIEIEKNRETCITGVLEKSGNGFTKQESRISPRILLFFLLNSFICTNGKRETKLYFLPVGRNKIKKTKIFLMRFLFRLFFCFVNPFSEKIDRKKEAENFL